MSGADLSTDLTTTLTADRWSTFPSSGCPKASASGGSYQRWPTRVVADEEVKLGRRVVYRECDVGAWIEEQFDAG